MAELDWSHAPKHLDFKRDTTQELLLEGSLASGKTTVALDKEIDAILRYPGIQILLSRWTEDACATKLKPAWEQLLSIRGEEAVWDAKQKCYDFPNGSRAFMFGLKAVSQIEMFNKIRGLSVARICLDQAEECNPLVAAELRARLRPDLAATMKGIRFPFQLTFVANPSDRTFWLSEEFPEGDKIKGRRLISLSIFDNPHLPPETIEGLVRAWPEDHPCHVTMIQGRRGPKMMGTPVFKGLYKKEHHWRLIALRPDVPVCESFEVGTNNPTWVFAQRMYAGGLAALGGIRGDGMMLEDFVKLVQDKRREWIPAHVEIKTCVAPMGENLKHAGQRYTLLDVLKAQMQIKPAMRQNGNAPDVRLAMVENLAGYLRRRNTAGDEELGVNNDDTRFVVCDRSSERKSPFLHYAFEAGFVWDEHDVSVANKTIRQCLDENQFAPAMHCLENIELNFCAGQQTPEDREHRHTHRRHQFDHMRLPRTSGDMAWALS